MLIKEPNMNYKNILCKTISISILVIMAATSSVSAFSSREILDTGKTIKTNFFNSIERSVVGKKWAVNGTVFDVKTDGWFLDWLNSTASTWDKTSLPLEWNNTATGSNDTTIWWVDINNLDVSTLKSVFVLKLKNSAGQIQDFSIIDKKYYDFTDFMYKNANNDNYEEFLKDTSDQIDVLDMKSWNLFSQFLIANKDEQTMDLINKLKNEIIPWFKNNVHSLQDSSSSFDWFLSKFAYSFWLRSWDSKILTWLNNPFSFGTVSYGTLASELQKSAEQAVIINSNWSLKKKDVIKKMKSSVGAAVKSPGSWFIVVEPPLVYPAPPAGVTDADITQKAKDFCWSAHQQVNPWYDSVNWGYVDWWNRLIAPGWLLNSSKAIMIYKRDGKFSSNSRYSFCAQPNWCAWWYTENPKRFWLAPYSQYIMQWGRLQWDTCTKSWKWFTFKWKSWKIISQ